VLGYDESQIEGLYKSNALHKEDAAKKLKPGK